MMHLIVFLCFPIRILKNYFRAKHRFANEIQKHQHKVICFLVGQLKMRSSVCVVALVVLVLPGVQTFVPIGSGNTHVTITGNAVMKKIYEVCEAVAESEGRSFKPTVSTLLNKHFILSLVIHGLSSE